MKLYEVNQAIEQIFDQIVDVETGEILSDSQELMRGEQASQSTAVRRHLGIHVMDHTISRQKIRSAVYIQNIAHLKRGLPGVQTIPSAKQIRAFMQPPCLFIIPDPANWIRNFLKIPYLPIRGADIAIDML